MLALLALALPTAAAAHSHHLAVVPSRREMPAFGPRHPLRLGQPQHSCRRAAAACCWLALNAWHGEKNGRGCHRRAQSVPAERRVGEAASKTIRAACSLPVVSRIT